jgi:predicted transcriptional regulator
MPTRILTSCEAEIMNVVWQRDAVTVPDVVNALPRPLAYTTVMTTMNILENKGFIVRGEKRGRAYVYRAQISSESASGNTATELASRFFDGSVTSMVLSLIKSRRISPEDVAELRAAIESLEQPT